MLLRPWRWYLQFVIVATLASAYANGQITSVGEQGVRHLALNGDTLVLTAKTHEMGEDHERKLVWQRVPAAQP